MVVQDVLDVRHGLKTEPSGCEHRRRPCAARIDPTRPTWVRPDLWSQHLCSSAMDSACHPGTCCRKTSCSIAYVGVRDCRRPWSDRMSPHTTLRASAVSAGRLELANTMNHRTGDKNDCGAHNQTSSVSSGSTLQHVMCGGCRKWCRRAPHPIVQVCTQVVSTARRR